VNELAKAAAAHGCEFADAPVAGSKAAAANGELNFLVGGSTGVVEKIRHPLGAMGKSISHLGPSAAARSSRYQQFRLRRANRRARRSARVDRVERTSRSSPPARRSSVFTARSMPVAAPTTWPP